VKPVYGLSDRLKPLSAAEEQVLLALWDCPAPATRRDISEKLTATGWAPATVLNFLYRLEEKGWVKGMTVRKMELGEPDASGRRRPVEIEGSDYTIDVDTVIMALGTSPNPLISSTTGGLEINKHRCIVADEANGQTSRECIRRRRCRNRCRYRNSRHGGRKSRSARNP
jgi:hypothetical protein